MTLAGDHEPATLTLTGLALCFHERDGSQRQVLADVSLELRRGRIVGLAGESGSGKSTTALSLMGMSIRGSTRLAGSLKLEHQSIFGLSGRALTDLWGRRIAYVAQGAGASLNPLRRIQFLLTEPMRVHLGVSRGDARARALELLSDVGIPEPAAALGCYPHEFSGGQQQRLALAIALACEPHVLLLDEPTSGLDVTTQAQINRLLVRLVQEHGLASLCISHDIGVLSEICNEIVIMYGGEVVERASARSILDTPRHPYTAALLSSIPAITEDSMPTGIPGRPPAQVITDSCSFAARCRFAEQRCREEHPFLLRVGRNHDARCLRAEDLGVLGRETGRVHRHATTRPDEPLLSVESLRCGYGTNRLAVDDVTFAIPQGAVVALVGESGSGKSTIVRAIAGLHEPSGGSISFDGRPLPSRASRRSRALRQAIQIVFQSADSSLNPRHTVSELIGRPLALFRPDVSSSMRRDELARMLEHVNLDPAIVDRRPHELSGGQRQRVALARAFAARPRLLLCDEVVSALDVSVAATVLESLVRLVDESGVAMLFVTHNLAIVPAIADYVVVMKDGIVVESGSTSTVVTSATHPYTQALLRAAEEATATGDTPAQQVRDDE